MPTHRMLSTDFMTSDHIFETLTHDEYIAYTIILAKTDKRGFADSVKKEIIYFEIDKNVFKRLEEKGYIDIHKVGNVEVYLVLDFFVHNHSTASEKTESKYKPILDNYYSIDMEGDRIYHKKSPDNISESNNDVSDVTTQENALEAEVDYNQFVKAWNEVATNKELPTIHNEDSWTDARKSKLKELVGVFGIDDVLKTIEKVGESKFLCGENDRKWRCSFGWLIEHENFEKVIEGNYDNQKNEYKFNGEDLSEYL